MIADPHMQRLLAFFARPENRSPHGTFLGMEILELGAARAIVRIPYDVKLAGNAATGVLHGGVITTVLDSVCGIAVFAALARRAAIATLDLRIDYLKPAVPGEPVLAEGHCYKVTRHVCFVRALAYHADPADPIANCTASFMVTARTGDETCLGGDTV